MDNSILIKRGDFLTMLKPLKRFAKKKAEEAVLSMEGGDFYISLIGITTGAPATGKWSGEVRVPGRLIWGIAMEPPAGDPIRIEVRDSRLYVGTLSVSCIEQKAWKSPIDLPIDTEFLKILRLRFLYPPERLDQAGLTRTLVQAQERARKIIARAAKILEPLNISEPELRQFVMDRLREGLEKK
jgi:hypothetical protein